MSEFEIGDYVKVQATDFNRCWAIGNIGRIIPNPNPSNGCFRVKFNSKLNADFKPEWLTKIDKETMEEQAPCGASHTDDRPVISFDENADKSRLISKSVFRFRDIVDEMAKTYEKKNADYGDSFAASINEWGPVAGLVRIQDKFNRAKNLLMNGRPPEVEEPVTDTLTDMSVYCILLRMCIEKQMSANGNT